MSRSDVPALTAPPSHREARAATASGNLISICRHVCQNPKSRTALPLCLILNMCLERIKGQSVVLNLGKCKNFSYSGVRKYECNFVLWSLSTL